MTSNTLNELLDQERQTYQKFLNKCRALLDADDELTKLHDPITHKNGKAHDRLGYHNDIVAACKNLLEREQYQARRRGAG